MCVVVFARGLATSAPRVGLPLICKPFMHTTSRGFHFLLCGLVCSMHVVVCDCTGVEVFGYDFLLNLL